MAKTLTFSDSHCHLDFESFSSNISTLLSQCHQAHIKNIVIPTVGPENWLRALNFAKEYSSKNVNLHTCLGIHPWFLNKLNSNSLAELEALLAQRVTEVVAIGEAGIDGVIAKDHDNINQQLSVFEGQLQLAKNYQLPIIVHHRRSHQYIVPLLKKYQLSKGGIIHAFSGSYQQACQYIDLGFKLGIGGTITYPRAEKTIKTVKRLPLDSLVLETDAPSMPLYGFQGQDNSPLRIIDVFKALSIIRAETADELAMVLEKNIHLILPRLSSVPHQRY
ncbi:TatD family hydrolase [Cognaticolwellia mytili]|uniref:TatD family hydrolase n=1 Tax=Cognaticolwellia mytili TaxID=1888913 RepID=UPI000A171CC0|nr:TatD family hydrolase [Cognaticolwellia mytili]